MSVGETGPFTRDGLLHYFVDAAKPRQEWRVGMEVERMARNAETGKPLPYETDDGPSIRRILEYYLSRRPADPIWEGNKLIGLDAEWGYITLEPGGQVEWSSRPAATLAALKRELDTHMAVLQDAEHELGVTWVEEAVDPVHGLAEMPWMPKARYGIMRPFLGSRGSLAHRMMTQSASIQCAFDYADAEDWLRKFKTAAFLAPVATALFANSPRIDGEDSGYRCYRQAIWRETDPERCGLPREVFRPDFDLRAWFEWVLQVPTIFRHRARGLVPSGGVPFEELMPLSGCDAISFQDWETHVSTIFTEVRSYTYIEVRSADLQPVDRIFAVPTFWTGLLYDDAALAAGGELGSVFAKHDDWLAGMQTAAREGLDGTIGGRPLRELAREVVSIATDGLRAGAACAGDPEEAVGHLSDLATEPRP